MAWSPTISVFDSRALRGALIDHFETYQSDALLWANDGIALPPIAKFHKSVRLVTKFPALTIMQASHRSSYEDIIEIELSMLFQVAVIHGDQDELTDRSIKYSMALESMLSNIPKTTFNTDSILTVNAEALEMETVFDVQARFKNQYIQVFETQVNWGLTGEAR